MEPVPRRWWTGPLDVEGLAWTAVGRVRDAASDLAAVRGLEVDVAVTPALVAASFDAYDHLRIDGRSPRVWAELSGFFAARDGWVRLHGNYPHHAAVTRTVLRIEDRADLSRVIAERDADEVAAALSEAGGIAAAVRTPEQWEAHPQAHAMAGDPWAMAEDRGDRPDLPSLRDRQRSAALPRSGPAAALLEGVRVLDMTRVIAGPTCSQLLACLGADVLRIDPPGRPEILDQHLSTGMGKRSAVVDLRRDAARIRALAAQADVILDGYRPEALAPLGLGTGALEELAPQAVIVSISAWGEHGPWGHCAGFDSIVQAATGIAAVCGTPERPGALPVQALDHSTGHLLAAHVLEALSGARAVTVRASLLGAAHRLLALPPPPEIASVDLEVPRVEVPWSGGLLSAVPPPLLVDGRTLEQPVGGYGAARPRWRES